MSKSITLGGRTFELRPLKLGQMRRLLDALEELAGKSGGALIEAAAGVIVAGLKPAHPDLTADALLDLEVTVEELNAAVADVLRVAGLKPEVSGSGEAAPVAISESSFAPSMAPSPPAAGSTTVEPTN